MSNIRADVTIPTQETLENMTPREVDERLSELYNEVGRYTNYLMSSLRYQDADQKRYADWHAKTPDTDGRVSLATYDETRQGLQAIETIAGYYEVLEALAVPTRAFDGEFSRRGGWTRFFLVQASNGHIHTSMHCTTCFADTWYAWLPSVSGKTEGEAVAEHGERLCTICYPSAPSAWTDGKAYYRKQALERKDALQAVRDTKATEKAAREAAKAIKNHYTLRKTVRWSGLDFADDPQSWEAVKKNFRNFVGYNGAATPTDPDSFYSRIFIVDLNTGEEVEYQYPA